MKNLSLSFRSFAASLLSAALSILSYAASYVLSAFEATVEYTVASICQTAESLKTGIYSFSVKVSGKAVSACDGFVSMRRSLDASATA